MSKLINMLLFIAFYIFGPLTAIYFTQDVDDAIVRVGFFFAILVGIAILYFVITKSIGRLIR